MDNTKRIENETMCPEYEDTLEDLMKLCNPKERLLKSINEASKMAHDEKVKYQKETMNNFIKHKGGRGFA